MPKPDDMTFSEKRRALRKAFCIKKCGGHLKCRGRRIGGERLSFSDEPCAEYMKLCQRRHG
jgi:hypothetical protein